MCQLNIYCVPKEIKKDGVINLLKNTFDYNHAECIDDEEPITELKNNYSFYIVGAFRCDCGSVLASQQEYEGDLSWRDLYDYLTNEEVKRLRKIKDFMEQRDYKKLRKSFEEDRQRLWAEVEKTGEDVREEQNKLINEVMSRKDISDEEKNNLINEKVYPRTNELMEKCPERIAAMKRYKEFIKQNDLMWQSWAYSLKGASRKTRLMSSQDFISDDCGSFKEETPSNCIYYAIEKAKRDNGQQAELEYNSIKDFADSILEEAENIKLFSFWQDGSPICVKGRKEVKQSELVIDDIAFLKYNEILTIYR